MTDIGKTANILVEISSGRDLLSGDITGKSDPYVICAVGKDEVHRTKPVRQTLNPTWGPKENNTFLLECTAAKLLDDKGMWCVVRDYDMLQSDDNLGQAHFKCADLHTEGAEERMVEKKVKPPKGHDGKDCGHLTIRVKKATPEDIEAIKKGEKKAYFNVKTGVFD